MVQVNERQLLFDEALRNIDFFFHYSGLKVNSRERPKYYSLRCRCLYLFNVLWLNTDLLAMIVWFLQGIQLGKTFTELTYAAPCLAITFLCNFKLNYLVYYEKNIDELVELLRAVEVSVAEREDDYKKVDHVIHEINFLNKLVKTVNIFNGCSVAMFSSLSPFILTWLTYHQTGEIDLPLPFLTVYPFDPYTYTAYPFVYLHQLWSQITVVLFTSAADYLFYTCCIFIRVHFRLLKTWIEDLIANQKLSEGRFKENEDFRRRFEEIIQQHQLLIRSVLVLEHVYAKSNLFQCVISSIIICLSGFNVTEHGDLSIVIFYTIFLLLTLMQTYFLCFFGDMIMSSSEEISQAIYNCNWYLAETKITRSLLIVQIRAQKPCKLTAYGFADINLISFMTILNTSWSYFALLKTVYTD